jgi:hypothetical protein
VGFDTRQGQEISSLLQNVQTSCGAHIVSVRGSVLRVKQPEHVVEHSPLSSAMVEDELYAFSAYKDTTLPCKQSQLGAQFFLVCLFLFSTCLTV